MADSRTQSTASGSFGGRPINPQELFGKQPPHSVAAEMCLLGAMLLDFKVINDVTLVVPGGDCFYSQAHGVIYDALIKVHEEKRAGDLVLLSEQLEAKDVLKDLGGVPYLLRLAEGVPSAVNAKHYATIVREKWILRTLIDAAGDILYAAYDAGQLYSDAAQAALDLAQQRIFEITNRAVPFDTEELHHLLKQMMDMLVENEGRSLTGLDTGFYELNEITSGLQNGEMIVLAARPSMGKTALALNLAEQVAFGGSSHNAKDPRAPVVFFSLEMSRQSLIQRLVCAHSGVDSQRVRRNMLSTGDFKRLIDSCNNLSTAPIFIDDTPGLTVMQLRAKSRRLAQQHKIKCIFVDYLQLLTAPGTSAKEGRQQEVSAISRGIKALARELEVPIVCLSQLNREAENREGHRPRMADLRESGSIEQDADTIMLLHREEYYHVGEPEWVHENSDKVGIAEIIIAKQRNGPTGTVELTWDSKSTRFKNLARRGGGNEFRADDSPSRGPAPYQAPRASGFSPGTKSGPVAGFRDGGGPDQDDDDGPAPF